MATKLHCTLMLCTMLNLLACSGAFLFSGMNCHSCSIWFKSMNSQVLNLIKINYHWNVWSKLPAVMYLHQSHKKVSALCLPQIHLMTLTPLSFRYPIPKIITLPTCERKYIQGDHFVSFFIFYSSDTKRQQLQKLCQLLSLHHPKNLSKYIYCN